MSRTRPQWRLAILGSACFLAGFAILLLVGEADASINPTSSANDVVAAMDPVSTSSWAAAWESGPLGNSAAVSSTPLTSFGANGESFSILSTGDATIAADGNNGAGSYTDNGGGHVRGVEDNDVTILRIDFTACYTGPVRMRVQFLSEEYPEYVQTPYKDSFIAEMDTSSWTTTPGDVDAPNAFILLDVDNPTLNPSLASGTTYDGGTASFTLSSAPVAPGPHAIYLSLFDFRDHAFDSAVFLDHLDLPCCPPPAAPSTPMDLNVASPPESPISLGWQPSTGCPDFYNIYRRELGLPWLPVPYDSVPATQTDYVDADFDPCKTYDYRVTAVRGTDESPSSNVDDGGWRKSHRPYYLGASIAPNADVTLDWDSPDDCITHYHLQRIVPPGAPIEIPYPTQSYVDVGGALNTDCLAYAVASHNHLALPPHDEPSQAAPWSWLRPSSPIVLTVTDGPAWDQAGLSWTSSGYCMQGYAIERSDIDAPYNWIRLAEVGPGQLTYLDETLNYCNAYHYRVRAMTLVQGSAYSNVGSVTKPTIPPNPPTSTSMDQDGPGPDTLAWANSDPVPCRPDLYVVAARLTGGPWQDVFSIPYPSTGAPVTLAYGCGVVVEFQVRARNVAGDSPADTRVVWQAPPESVDPGPPTNLRAGAGLTSAELLWDPPPDNGCRLLGFNVYRRAPLEAWPAEPVNAWPVLSAGFVDHPPGCAPWEYRVHGITSVGETAGTNVAGIVMPMRPPGPPRFPDGSVHDDVVRMHWLPPLDNGCPVDGYRVIRRLPWATSAMSEVGDVAAPQFLDHPPDTSCAFQYVVLAYNGVSPPFVLSAPQGGWGQGGPDRPGDGRTPGMPWSGLSMVQIPGQGGQGPVSQPWTAVGLSGPEEYADPVTEGRCRPVPDVDLDGIQDMADLCPALADRPQEDGDHDGRGDACDPLPQPAPAASILSDGPAGAAAAGDVDLDGVADAADNCVTIANRDQADLDTDGAGDACDGDMDGDGVGESGEAPDLCPGASDPAQKDSDGDGLGDLCDDEPLAALAPRAREQTAAQAPTNSWSGVGWAVLAAVAVAALAVAFMRRRAGP